MIQSSSDFNGHKENLPNIQDKITEEIRPDDNINRTSSLDEGLKLCISGLEFSISNTKTNGDNIIRIELKIPNDSSVKQEKKNDTNNKDDEARKIEVGRSLDNVQKRIVSDPSLTPSINFTSNSTIHEFQREIQRASPSLKVRRMDKKTLRQSVRSNSSDDSGISTSDHHIPMAPSKYQKRKLDEEKTVSSEICRICGDEASKFIHYGGRSCQSCRAFFRRTVEKQSK